MTMLIVIPRHKFAAHSVRAVKYTECLQRGKTPTIECPAMTLNDLMVRLQSWSTGECNVYPFVAVTPWSTLTWSDSIC